MGVLFLFLSVLAGMFKVVAMKKCGAAASGPKNSLKINVIRSTGCVIISLAVCAFSGFAEMNGIGVLCSVLAGVFTAFFLFSWVLATQKASLLVVQIVCMIFGVMSPMILVPILSDAAFASAIQWGGALLLFPAAICFAKKAASKQKTSLSALPILFLMGISNGGSVTARKLYMDLGEGTAADFNLTSYAVAAVILTSLLVISTLRGRRTQTDVAAEKPKRSFYILVGIAVVTLYIADYLSTLASGRLAVQLLVPLSYIFSMPMTLAADVVIFKEKFTIRAAIGILFVIGSAILTSM